VIDPGSVILSAGRPVLLPAESLAPVRAESVVVAWKDSREARRAVTDAMPFLVTAKQVTVVTVEEEAVQDAKSSAADVVRFLTKHGVSASPVVVDVGAGQAVDALEEIAAEIGANLVVAGGYGHSRLREWAFGGLRVRCLQRAGSTDCSRTSARLLEPSVPEYCWRRLFASIESRRPRSFAGRERPTARADPTAVFKTLIHIKVRGVAQGFDDFTCRTSRP
jgi:nucleotide-binding universal stress UspA family protein